MKNIKFFNLDNYLVDKKKFEELSEEDKQKIKSKESSDAVRKALEASQRLRNYIEFSER